MVKDFLDHSVLIGRSPARRLLARPVQRPGSRPHDSADAQDRTQCLIHRSIRRKGLSYFRVQEHEIGPGAILVDVIAPHASFHGGEVVLRKHTINTSAVSVLHRTFVRDVLPVWP